MSSHKEVPNPGNLAEIDTEGYIHESTQIRFCLCLPIRRFLLDACCCCSLQKGIIVIGILDIAYSCLRILFAAIFINLMGMIFPDPIFWFDCTTGWFGILGLCAASRQSPLLAKMYYYFKFIQAFISPMLIMIFSEEHYMLRLLYILILTIVNVYELRVIYSFFIHLYSGHTILVNSGRDVLNIMKNIREQVSTFNDEDNPTNTTTDLELDSEREPVD